MIFKYHKKQNGFGMIELLISIVILSIGLLGLAALHTSVIRNNQSSYYSSVATIQIYAMADRMRVNLPGVTAGAYNNISGTPSNPTCDPCTNQQVAQRDQFEWNTDNGNLLPSGSGTVTGNGTTFTITVRWDNDRTGATGIACSGNTDSDLTCQSMVIRL